ncbi:CinA family protein [Nevskia ramosa]|uniref:CinA family protein n=1 Tax=Nevskia ramosa TaxID=64002 RepID=UPI0003B67EC7|nr:CinA family protein [Nevskia ramosa]
MTATIPDDASLNTLAASLGQKLLARGEMIGTAESCTGGLIAKLMTDIAGSSGWFERGIVSYSNSAKQELLGVAVETIETFGAVSGPTVIAMADGLKARAPVQWTVSVSGIAGPGGGVAGKPVGTVFIAWAGPDIATSSSRYQFDGDRDAVRRLTAEAALKGLLDLLDAAAAA